MLPSQPLLVCIGPVPLGSADHHILAYICTSSGWLGLRDLSVERSCAPATTVAPLLCVLSPRPCRLLANIPRERMIVLGSWPYNVLSGSGLKRFLSIHSLPGGVIRRACQDDQKSFEPSATHCLCMYTSVIAEEGHSILRGCDLITRSRGR